MLRWLYRPVGRRCTRVGIGGPVARHYRWPVFRAVHGPLRRGIIRPLRHRITRSLRHWVIGPVTWSLRHRVIGPGINRSLTGIGWIAGRSCSRRRVYWPVVLVNRAAGMAFRRRSVWHTVAGLVSRERIYWPCGRITRAGRTIARATGLTGIHRPVAGCSPRVMVRESCCRPHPVQWLYPARPRLRTLRVTIYHRPV